MNFRAALGDPVKTLDEYIGDGAPDREHVVCNITGRFKAINGFVQTWAMINAIRCAYVFEGSEAILEIPSLPVRLDAEAMVRSNLHVVRRMSIFGSCARGEAGGLSPLMVMEDDGQAALSEWGMVIWKKYQHAIYAAEVLEPITSRIVISPGFKKEVERQHEKNGPRIEKINSQIDRFAQYLEDNSKHVKSLDFKELKGRHEDLPCTHAFDA